jgi:hypothetical protein
MVTENKLLFTRDVERGEMEFQGCKVSAIKYEQV